MAYGLWLYKEIINDTGKKTRLEIEKRDYTGASYEITALKGDIVLSVDVDSPTAPIIKSNLSFSIVDTAQVTYSDFFTPDATLYRVKVYDVNGQTQAIRWTGYITPDSFGEPLTYRGEINLTARDNLGYLNDLEFDYNNATTEQYASIKDIVNAAVAKIGGMPVTWNVQKKAATAANGTFDNIENAIVSTYAMLGDNWGNVISELLKGIGCQLRYIDANTFGIYDIENLSDGSVFSPQAVRFLEGSGYREIQPAWKRCVFNQDYQLYTEKEISAPTSYSGEIAVLQNDSKRVNYGAAVKMCYNAAGWYLRRGSSLSPELWALADPIGSPKGDSGAVYIPFFDTEDETRLGMYIQKGIPIANTDKTIKCTFRISPMERATKWGMSSGAPGNVAVPFHPYWRVVYDIEKYFYYNIVFITDGGVTYVLRNEWMLENALTENKMLSVSLPETDILHTLADITIEVSILTVPGSGTLAVRFYPPSGSFRTSGPQGGGATYHTESCIMVKTIQVTIDDDADTLGGRSRQGYVNAAHNVTEDEEYVFGQIPSGSYGIVFYKGGLFKDDSVNTPYSHFKRNSSAGAVDNLLDLIGRETIQYRKKSYNILSGSVKPSDRTRAISFSNNISYGGKSYLILSAALSLLENTMQVTQMLEVENYTEEAGIVFSDYTGKNSYSGRSGGGCSSSGGSSIYDHQQLTGRDAADAHPASAITGLSDFMAAMNEMFELEGAGTSASPYVIKAKHDTYTNDSLSAATIYLPHNGTLDRVYDLGVDTDAVTAEVPSEGGGSAVWGGITGTLANQTDLANALAAKADASRVLAIEALIPGAATSSNKLADIAFVNSSIATSTATFRGTSASGLTEAQFLAWANGLTHDANDYVFWNTIDADGNTLYKRYKYTGTAWEFEYTLNNSSFTAAQWAAINSGATANGVSHWNTAYGWGNHATEGYLKSITKAMVENVLTGNISSHTHSYLPLSGGILSNAAYASQLIIHRNQSANDAVIVFSNNDGQLGYIGVGGASNTYPNQPIFVPMDGQGSRKIYHSGNCNNTSTPWSASSLTLNGVISGATNINSKLAFNSDSIYSSVPFTAFGNSYFETKLVGSSIYFNQPTREGGWRSQISYQQAGTQIGVLAGANLGTTGVTSYFLGGTTYATCAININGSTGNVGIGTNSPSQKLTVNGGVCMTTLYLPNNGSMSTTYSLSVNTNAISAEIPS